VCLRPECVWAAAVDGRTDHGEDVPTP
jgi:hypothetical protein